MILAFESRQEYEIFLFFITCRPALGSIQPPVDHALGFFSGVKAAEA
jgi:hypothetical protein